MPTGANAVGIPTAAEVYLDGKEIELNAYNIGGVRAAKFATQISTGEQ